MEYEREKKEKLILQKLDKKKKNNERTFLGHRINFPDVSKCSGGNEFTKMLNDKFKVKKGTMFFAEETNKSDGKFNLHHSMS